MSLLESTYSGSAFDTMSTSTPSPTASGTSIAAASASSTSSRRPPRKSTLTQQQKNQKRQRATQDQLVLLEVEFNQNPTPTAAVRERIAQDINMTERSVQIWFQNRRAKIKLLAKKSIETGEDCDAIPESYRHYLAGKAMDTSTLLPRNFITRGGSMAGYGNSFFLNPDHASTQKVVIHHFACRSLSIGTWRRLGQNAMDLIIFYSLGEKPALTYYINNDNAGYKIEFPFSYIKNITLIENGSVEEGNGPANQPAGIQVELNRPPNFFMDDSGSGGFYQTGDFTEDQQASQIMMHNLGGDPKVLSGQLAKLVSLDSFINRHNPFEANVIAASAPVSPIGTRPQSQQSRMSHSQMNMFHENAFGMGLGVSTGRGQRGFHQRTRSKSLPINGDFNAAPSAMPISFHVQRPSNANSASTLYQPVPQHHNNLISAGSHLRIDTSTNYGVALSNYPMSQSSASPSEYASPSFYPSAPHMDHMHNPGYSISYGMPFFSPMLDPSSHMIQPSVSPLSAISHADPVIADQSPPMPNMHRSASADFLSMSQDHHTGLSDGGHMLSELYSKQNLNLPMHSPGIDGSDLGMDMHDEPPQDDMDMTDMTDMTAFDTVDPSEINSHPSIFSTS